MSSTVALLPTNHFETPMMEKLPADMGGTFSWIGVAVTGITAGAMGLIGWLRRNNINNAEADARLDAIKNLQEMLAAERTDHAAEVAALRQENATLRDRADKFASERNEWMQKFSEVSGELRAVRFQLQAVREEVAALRGQSVPTPPATP